MLCRTNREMCYTMEIFITTKDWAFDQFFQPPIFSFPLSVDGIKRTESSSHVPTNLFFLFLCSSRTVLCQSFGRCIGCISFSSLSTIVPYALGVDFVNSCCSYPAVAEQMFLGPLGLLCFWGPYGRWDTRQCCRLSYDFCVFFCSNYGYNIKL